MIVKPEAMSQGKGIFITKKLEDISPGVHCVVQRYMKSPYLIDNYKFDLRIYVLVTSCDPLKIFVHREGLARFASEPYTHTENFENAYIHLTNYAINKNNDKFQQEYDENDESKGFKRSLQSVFDVLERDGVNIDLLKERIRDIIRKTLICIQPDLTHNYRMNQPSDREGTTCFEILGFDIFIDKNAKPWLLEVNHAPSFNTDTALDNRVKRELITDTFRLLNITFKEKQRRQQLIREENEAKKLKLARRQELRFEQIRKQIIVRETYEEKNMGGFERIFPITSLFASAHGEDGIDKLFLLERIDYYNDILKLASNFLAELPVKRPREELRLLMEAKNSGPTPGRAEELAFARAYLEPKPFELSLRSTAHNKKNFASTPTHNGAVAKQNGGSYIASIFQDNSGSARDQQQLHQFSDMLITQPKMITEQRRGERSEGLRYIKIQKLNEIARFNDQRKGTEGTNVSNDKNDSILIRRQPTLNALYEYQNNELVYRGSRGEPESDGLRHTKRQLDHKRDRSDRAAHIASMAAEDYMLAYPYRRNSKAAAPSLAA